tara:strand:+ start:12282 stop:15272 length:2991 start_codon:yes stop_codon:yes gene_type:complete
MIVQSAVRFGAPGMGSEAENAAALPAAEEEDDDMVQFQEPGADAQIDGEPYDGISLEEALNALTADNAEIRARAADALLDVPAGGALSGQRGAPWAYAVVAAGAVIPLLHLVQRVRRDGRDGLKPKPTEECPENTEAVCSGGDAALLVLAEIANAAASFLAEEGWEVAYDEDSERPIFVDENSGMSQATPPELECAKGDWVVGVMIETLTLIQPLDVDENTHEPRWPVRVVHHVARQGGGRAGEETNTTDTTQHSLSVLDIAVEEGSGSEFTRVLVVGPWRGSRGEVAGETDPDEPPGTALDSWADATVFASLVLGLAVGKAPAFAVGDGDEKSILQKKTSFRVLVLGLRCGAVPAFLKRMLPNVSVDVFEPDLRVASAARDFFNATFVEENVSHLTSDGFESRINTGCENRLYRVWTGADVGTFLAKIPEGTTFGAVIGDLPDWQAATSFGEGFDRKKFWNSLERVADPTKSTVALAGARRGFHEACAGARDTFGAENTYAACDPDDDLEEDLEEGDVSRPAKRAKTAGKGKSPSGFGDAGYSAARGRAGVLVASLGRNRAFPDWIAYTNAARALHSAGVLCEPSPFAVAFAELAGDENASRVWNVSYRAAEEDLPIVQSNYLGDAAAVAAARGARALAEATHTDTANDAVWDVFGTTDESPSGKDKNVGDPEYWARILETSVCDGPVAFTEDVSSPSPDRRVLDQHAKDVTHKGYVWDDVVVPPDLTSTLARAIGNATKNNYPPAVVFLTDAAWTATSMLWRRAFQLLRGDGNGSDFENANHEIMLEPSLAAFALDQTNDKAGRRYVGNNFGAPHRDYATKDVRVGDGSSKDVRVGDGSERDDEKTAAKAPSILSAWLPLVDISLRNGCMYVVPRDSDLHDEQTPPGFVKAGAVPLAPAKAGALMAWAGDTIHWGTGCSSKLETGEVPRLSLAFVFRRRSAKCDARGTALTYAECCAGKGLPLERRLEVVRHALTCFEHWYGDTAKIRQELTPK